MLNTTQNELQQRQPEFGPPGLLDLFGVEATRTVKCPSCRRDSEFFEKLSKVEISAARRIIAKEPEELFIKSPHLAKDYAERLNDKWWVDINISQQQVETRIKDACKIVGLKFGVDLTLEFPEE